MQYSLYITAATNGFIVYDSHPAVRGDYQQPKAWVASNERELGELIERLAKELKTGKFQ